MRVYKRKGSQYYFCDYLDPYTGNRVRESLKEKDRVIAQRMVAEREKQAKARADGRGDFFDDEAKRPLSDHVADWEAAVAENASARHVADSLRRVNVVFNARGMHRWRDIRLSSVQRWLKDSQDAGSAAATRNRYIEALRRFCRWMVEDGRAPSHPLRKLKQRPKAERKDRRLVRRAYTEPELGRLLDVARNGPVRVGMTGQDRAVLYELAFSTGLRSNECRGLTRFAFDLGTSPSVTVDASLSKNGDTATLPLRRDFAARLTDWFAQREESGPMFNMPHKCNVVRMLRMDLNDAQIATEDAAGRVVDFHAFRHTFCTRLALSGVQPKQMQTLARHSTIDLTMGYYTHVGTSDLVSAVESMPSVRTQSKQVIGS